MTLATGVNAAFTATGGGTVTVLDPSGVPSNTITTTTGRALNVSNTTLARATSRSSASRPARRQTPTWSADGPVNGISLDTTGNLGGLIVTGAGGTCTSPPTCTGGTIQRSTGDAIRLVSTRDVSLTRMRIHDNDSNGIYGDELTNFSLSNVRRQRQRRRRSAATEAGIKFNELYGTASITNTAVLGTKGDNIRLEMASGTLNNFTLSNVTVGPTADLGGGVYANGLSILTGGAGPTITATVSNSTFTGVDITRQQESGIFTDIGAGTTTLSVLGSDFDYENTGDRLSGIGGMHRFHVDDNDLLWHRDSAIDLRGWSMDGTVNNNRVGGGALDSGSELTAGISAIHSGNASWTLALTNNTVRNTEIDGIFVLSGAADGDIGTVNLTVSNNTVFPPDDNTGSPTGPNGMWFRSHAVDNDVRQYRQQRVARQRRRRRVPRAAQRHVGVPPAELHPRQRGGHAGRQRQPDGGCVAADGVSRWQRLHRLRGGTALVPVIRFGLVRGVSRQLRALCLPPERPSISAARRRSHARVVRARVVRIPAAR